MALRATPWDWRAAQGLATSALTALSWGADAAPLLLQLLMACVTAAACLMPAERLGARRQGVGLLFSAMKPSVSVGEEKTEGDTGVWAGLRGTLQRTGASVCACPCVCVCVCLCLCLPVSTRCVSTCLCVRGSATVWARE